jgi:hypothetical protein
VDVSAAALAAPKTPDVVRVMDDQVVRPVLSERFR